MIYVTHDQVEAMTLGDRVAVLKDGVLQQVAPPMELYRRPANQFVAGFIGSPAMNFVEGTLRRDDGAWLFTSPALTLPIACSGAPEERVVLGVRPQHITIGAPAGDHAGVARGEVTVVELLGDQQIVHVTLPNGVRLVATAPPDLPVTADETVSLRIAPDAVHLFRASDGMRIAPE
jgi:ABC-type sugar transport system ATPase subunit